MTYSWRPSYRSHRVVHVTVDGQTRRTSAGHQLRWVWSVCAESVDPDGMETPESVRCPECLAWERAHGT